MAPSAPRSRSDSAPIAPLTGIRAVAAYLVFFHHFPVARLIAKGFDLQREMHIGVVIFYVLSGFLITYRYRTNYSLNADWFKGYFKKRFARIYPLYFILAVATLLLSRDFSPQSWFLNLSLAKGFFDSYKFAGIPQAWSLTVEECFYASAPFLFLLYGKTKSLKVLFGAMAMVLAGILLIFGLLNWHTLLAPPRFVLLYTYFGRFTEFLIGFALAVWLQQGKLDKPLKIPATYAGIAGILACLAGLALLKTDAYAYGLYHPLGIFVNNAVLPLFVALVLFGLIKEKTLVSLVLASRLFQTLGKASYAFYLVHVGKIAELVRTSLDIHNVFVLFFAQVIFSVLLYYLIEHPLNDLIRNRRFFSKSRTLADLPPQAPAGR